jgi:hypothetical protein
MYHADVQAMCNDALKAIKAGGKKAGILTFNVELAKKQFAQGFDFIAVGGDAGMLARGAEALAKQFATEQQGLIPCPNACQVLPQPRQFLLLYRREGPLLQQIIDHAMQKGAVARLQSQDPLPSQSFSILPQGSLNRRGSGLHRTDVKQQASHKRCGTALESVSCQDKT